MSIFKEEDKQETKVDSSQESTPTSSNDFGDQLDSIKNDKGERKYGSVSQALEALKHSQEYIPDLKSEKEVLSKEVETLRAQQEKIDSLTEIVTKLTATKEPEAHQPQAEPEVQDVAKLVEQALEANSQAKTIQSNTDSVTKKLVELYGTKAESTFYEKAQELGMSKEAFNQLAATSPKAVISFFDKADTPSMMKGSQNTNHSYTPPQEEGFLKASEKSVMAGATTRDLMAEMARHKQAVYAKHNIS
jgi:archaellum component FlaC